MTRPPGKSGPRRQPNRRPQKPPHAPSQQLPLNRWVWRPSWGALVSHDVPFRDGLSGHLDIIIDLKTDTIIGGASGDREVYPLFARDGAPLMPDSSLQAMTSGIIEIAAFGQVGDRIDNRRGAGGKRAHMALKGGFLRRQIDNGEIKFYLLPCDIETIDFEDIESNVPKRKRNAASRELRNKKSLPSERYAVVEGFPFDIGEDDERAKRLVVTGRVGHKKKNEFLFVFSKTGLEDQLNDSFNSVWTDFIDVHEPPGRDPHPAWRLFRDRGYRVTAARTAKQDEPWGLPFNEGGYMPVFYLEDPLDNITQISMRRYLKPLHPLPHDLVRNSAPDHFGRADGLDLPRLVFGEKADDGGRGLKRRAWFDFAKVVEWPDGIGLSEAGPYVTLTPRSSYEPLYQRPVNGQWQPWSEASNAEIGRKLWPVRENFNLDDKRAVFFDEWNSTSATVTVIAADGAEDGSAVTLSASSGTPFAGKVGSEFWVRRVIPPVHGKDASDVMRIQITAETGSACNGVLVSSSVETINLLNAPLTQWGFPVTSLSGLGLFEGKKVRVRADGKDFEAETVANGAVSTGEPVMRGWVTLPNEARSITTLYHAMPKGAKFRTRLHFHNLRPPELGALVWALTLGRKPSSRPPRDEKEQRFHRLGGGKFAGLGVVRLEIDNDGSRIIPNDPTVGDGQAPGLDAVFEAFEDEISNAYDAAARDQGATDGATEGATSGETAWRRSVQIKGLFEAATPARSAGKTLKRMNGYEEYGNLKKEDNPADWLGLGGAGGHELEPKPRGDKDEEQPADE